MHRRKLKRRYGHTGEAHQWTPPRRVQVMVDAGTFKKGQYGLIIAQNSKGGMWLQDRRGPPGLFGPELAAIVESKPGEVAYLVGKSVHGGALWYSEAALRFTKQRKAK